MTKIHSTVHSAVMRVIVACGFLCLTLFMGCKQSSDVPAHGEEINFKVSANDLRGSIVTSNSFYPDMSVTAYLHNDAWSMATSRSPYFTHLKVSRSSGYSSGYPWLGNPAKKFSFFAFAPYDVATLNGLELSYTVPADPSAQKDLVVAKQVDVPANSGTSVPLQFKHTLVAISFKTHTDLYTCTIRSIELVGIPSKGNYDLDGQKWLTTTEPATYLLTPNVKHTSGSSIDISKASPLFLLPGTLPEGAALRVTLENEQGKINTYEVKLKGVSFTAGTHATIRLSLAGIRLELDGMPWEYHEYKRGFLTQDAILFIDAPKWVDNDSILTSLDSEVQLKIRFLQPLGVEWTATLTNGLDFAFKPGIPSGGITRDDQEEILTIVPRKPQSDTKRTTELYLMVYGKEVDPDKTYQSNGPLNIGKGHRIVITQANR